MEFVPFLFIETVTRLLGKFDLIELLEVGSEWSLEATKNFNSLGCVESWLGVCDDPQQRVTVWLCQNHMARPPSEVEVAFVETCRFYRKSYVKITGKQHCIREAQLRNPSIPFTAVNMDEFVNSIEFPSRSKGSVELTFIDKEKHLDIAPVLQAVKLLNRTFVSLHYVSNYATELEAFLSGACAPGELSYMSVEHVDITHATVAHVLGIWKKMRYSLGTFRFVGNTYKFSAAQVKEICNHCPKVPHEDFGTEEVVISRPNGFNDFNDFIQKCFRDDSVYNVVAEKRDAVQIELREKPRKSFIIRSSSTSQVITIIFHDYFCVSDDSY